MLHHLKNALQAVLLAAAILQTAAPSCDAQTRTAANRTTSKSAVRPSKHTNSKSFASNAIARDLATSSRRQPQPVPRSGVRQAAAAQSLPVQHSPTLAPAVTHGVQEPISIMESELGDEAFTLNDQHHGEPNLASSCDGCDTCGGIESCCCIPTGFLFDWTRADLWAGTTGFTVPANVLTTSNNSTGAVEGSFGFQEGINFGTRLPSVLCGQVGSQLGARFIQSHLNGSAAGIDNRNQAFVTGGLFRRVDYGFQGGLVVDYLHDDWIYKTDLLQLRGELSFLLSPCHELGFRFTDSQQIDDTSYRLPGAAAATDIRLTTLNTYRGFYRFRFSERARGQAELQAGWTEDSSAILGLTLNTPLQNQVGLATSATYLLPPSHASPQFAAEGWNISLAIVWTPGRTFGLARDYYRPLFDVADNGTMISKLD